MLVLGDTREPYDHGTRLGRALAEPLARLAGVKLGGDQPCDPQIHDERFFGACLTRGTLGFGESYVEGWWSCDDLEELVFRLSTHRYHQLGRALPTLMLSHASSRLRNGQTPRRSMRVAEQHYNFGNDLFFSFLGTHRNYSSALFEGTDQLDEAQRNKMDRICRLLDLSEKDHLLDVGGGWGHFAYHAAVEVGCRVTSINIADEQIRYARELCQGLPVEIRRADYRELDGKYTKAAVIAMLTHVGPKNYRRFFSLLYRCLHPGSLILIESLGSLHAKTSLEPWTERYIFPGGVVPSLRQIDRGAKEHFRTESAQEWGAHYVPTLRAWHSNLIDNWPELASRTR